MFLAACIIVSVVYLTNPEKVSIGPMKIANMITLDLGGANNSPIAFFILGAINTLIGVTFSALIAVILTKIPFIGRIKITPTVYDEQVFD